MDNTEFSKAYYEHGKSFGEENSPFKGYTRAYQNGDKIIKPEFSRDDYEYYRPGESIPAGKNQDEQHKIMVLCGQAYETVGVIRSVIDMMSEFGVEGLDIVHEDAVPNAFYKAWAKRIELLDRGERFLSYAFKKGNVVIRRQYGTVNSKKVRELQNDLDEKEISNKIARIPLKYFFYDPASIQIIGDSFAPFSQSKVYGLKMAAGSLTSLKNPSTEAEKTVFESLPEEIKNAIRQEKTVRGHYVVKLPAEKIYVDHYKKDDNEIWAKSFIYSVLTDVQYLKKLKQAKISTLDSMINVTRLWKLGDHVNGALPHPNAGAKLAGMIGNNTGAGPIDIIWDSAISLQEFYPPIKDLAGLNENIPEILIGLGIPEGLIGSGEEGKTSTSVNSVNLKTLLKRLETGRRMLRRWLEYEIDIIQKEMGFRKRPTIRFAHSDLYDEQVYLKLLVDLADRNIISNERLLEIIHETPSLEKLRINKETAEREAGRLPEKASPYHNPQLNDQQKHEITKQKMANKQQQQISDQKTNTENLSKVKPSPNNKPGRPDGSPDQVKRKPRRAKAELLLPSFEVHDFVHTFVTSLMLQHYKVENARQLNSSQKESIDLAKRELMANIEPDLVLSEETIKKIFVNRKVDNTKQFNLIYNSLLKEYDGEKLSNDSKRILLSEAYSILWSE